MTAFACLGGGGDWIYVLLTLVMSFLFDLVKNVMQGLYNAFEEVYVLTGVLLVGLEPIVLEGLFCCSTCTLFRGLSSTCG